MCKEACVYSTAVRDVLTHLAPCWIQGTVHSYIKQSGIQHKIFRRQPNTLNLLSLR